MIHAGLVHVGSVQGLQDFNGARTIQVTDQVEYSGRCFGELATASAFAHAAGKQGVGYFHLPRHRKDLIVQRQ